MRMRPIWSFFMVLNETCGQIQKDPPAREGLGRSALIG